MSEALSLYLNMLQHRQRVFQVVAKSASAEACDKESGKDDFKTASKFFPFPADVWKKVYCMATIQEDLAGVLSILDAEDRLRSRI